MLGASLIILFAFVWPSSRSLAAPVTADPVLPVATLVLGLLGVTARLVRVGVVDAHERTSSPTRGCAASRSAGSFGRHVFPNALAPTLQVFAMAAGDFVGTMWSW